MYRHVQRHQYPLLVGVTVLLFWIIFWIPHTQRSTSSICWNVARGRFVPHSMPRIMAPRLCDEFVAVAEMHASRRGGWTTRRHDHYPTTDLDTIDIPRAWIPVQNIVYRHIIPRITAQYRLNPLKLGINEIFIAKYSARPGHQKKLQVHKDGADFSFVVALNDAFDGGGTAFYDKDGRRVVTHLPRKGDGVMFCGRTKHAGLTVTKGTRYIMAGFLYYDHSTRGCGVF